MTSVHQSIEAEPISESPLTENPQQDHSVVSLSQRLAPVLDYVCFLLDFKINRLEVVDSKQRRDLQRCREGMDIVETKLEREGYMVKDKPFEDRIKQIFEVAKELKGLPPRRKDSSTANPSSNSLKTQTNPAKPPSDPILSQRSSKDTQNSYAGSFSGHQAHMWRGSEQKSLQTAQFGSIVSFRQPSIQEQSSPEMPPLIPCQERLPEVKEYEEIKKDIDEAYFSSQGKSHADMVYQNDAIHHELREKIASHANQNYMEGIADDDELTENYNPWNSITSQNKKTQEPLHHQSDFEYYKRSALSSLGNFGNTPTDLKIQNQNTIKQITAMNEIEADMPSLVNHFGDFAPKLDLSSMPEMPGLEVYSSNRHKNSQEALPSSRFNSNYHRYLEETSNVDKNVDFTSGGASSFDTSIISQLQNSLEANKHRYS